MPAQPAKWDSRTSWPRIKNSHSSKALYSPLLSVCRWPCSGREPRHLQNLQKGPQEVEKGNCKKLKKSPDGWPAPPGGHRPATRQELLSARGGRVGQSYCRREKTGTAPSFSLPFSEVSSTRLTHSSTSARSWPSSSQAACMVPEWVGRGHTMRPHPAGGRGGGVGTRLPPAHTGSCRSRVNRTVLRPQPTSHTWAEPLPCTPSSPSARPCLPGGGGDPHPQWPADRPRQPPSALAPRRLSGFPAQPADRKQALGLHVSRRGPGVQSLGGGADESPTHPAAAWLRELGWRLGQSWRQPRQLHPTQGISSGSPRVTGGGAQPTHLPIFQRV